MESVDFNINSFLSNMSISEFNNKCTDDKDFNYKTEFNYESELNNLIENNNKEYVQLKENIELLHEIIFELEQKEQKIKDKLNYLEKIQDNSIKLFSEISRKKY